VGGRERGRGRTHELAVVHGGRAVEHGALAAHLRYLLLIVGPRVREPRHRGGLKRRWRRRSTVKSGLIMSKKRNNK
jgi:hypothetical protein